MEYPKEERAAMARPSTKPLISAGPDKTLRDEFATMATDADVASISESRWVGEKYESLDRATRRYMWADAMLAARQAKS